MGSVTRAFLESMLNEYELLLDEADLNSASVADINIGCATAFFEGHIRGKQSAYSRMILDLKHLLENKELRLKEE